MATTPTGIDLPNPPPLVDPTAPKPALPVFWVPSEKEAMQFTNLLWALGFQDAAARYWASWYASAHPSG